MDSGMFRPMQLAAVEALGQGPEWFRELNAEYGRRRELAGRIFDLIGARYDKSSSGMFLWGKVDGNNPLSKAWKKAGCPGRPAGAQPEAVTTLSEDVSDAALYGAGVFITPGLIFGKNGEKHVRISLCAKPQVLEDAFRRLEEMMAV